MARVAARPLPDQALLKTAAAPGDYLDCFSIEVPGQVTLNDFVAAFYTTPLFRLERLVLTLPLRRWIHDAEVTALAHDQAQRFAAWQVLGRDDTQILLQDMGGRTRSWLSVEQGDNGTRLLFGSGVTQVTALIRWTVPLHRLYARALLAAAARRLA